MNPETETVETPRKHIHWDAHQQRSLLATPAVYHSPHMEKIIPKAMIEKLSMETEGIFYLVADEPLPRAANRAEEEAIGTGAKQCPFCQDGVVHRLCRGKETGVEVLWPVRCYCAVYKKYFSRWNNPSYVGALARDSTMANLLNGSLRNRFNLTDEGYATIVAAVRD